MNTDTARFGNVEYEDADVINFSVGMLGFEQLHSFVLIAHKENSPFRWLQSLDDESIAFLVTSPGELAPEYAPTICGADAKALQMDATTPHIVYCVVTIPPGRPQEMTLNLAGPIVINLESRDAKQIVLDDDRWSSRFPVADAAGEAERTAA